ncbi:DUF887-domain-containing protein [Corynespora cassiicola Philippines]|uniref:DUF887-domain-containing protein n=1 Tax=Corynespora cassiicola Philippines TaxID=1448308 RepID=A0A2T2P7Q8_CORCC|nr:DUF887-domain-containing protein [Corynespora cassiicola Philippines]
MHDPFPLPRPAALTSYIEPLSARLSLHTLPLHLHEVLLAYLFYHLTNTHLSPLLSRALFPRIYPSFSARTKLNWDVHVVSLVQSTLICALALWVMWTDGERAAMGWEERVWGYTGASGLIQACAGGYFVWDLVITVQNVGVFGWGMLAHAVSALFVFSLGFRPFVNFYAPTFILYELSSPFLNIHWFCDKLNLTGSRIQLYNGILLLTTFFSCRLIWGSYQSIRVFSDVYRAMSQGPPAFDVEKAELGTMRFAAEPVPLWLAFCYLASNITLNGLNWFWFGKMIETIRKRFDPPYGTRRPEKEEKKEKKEEDKVLVEGIDVDTPATTPYVEGEGVDYVSVKTEKSGTHLEVEQAEVRSRGRRRG